MELGPHCLSFEKPTVHEKALQYPMTPRTDHLAFSSIPQKRQTHTESLQLLSVPVPIMDAVPCSTASYTGACFQKFQGVFLNMKSMAHLQTPTGYIPNAPDSACSK